MQILVEHEDGTKTILFEPGDRVRFIRTDSNEWMFPEVGALGTVIRRSRPHPKNNGKPSSIDFLDVRTDEMAAGGWGTIHVPPWYLEFIAGERPSPENPPADDNFPQVRFWMNSEEQEKADSGTGRKKSEAEFLERISTCLDEGWCPTQCPGGCIVEPDGICPHGDQSVALEYGLI